MSPGQAAVLRHPQSSRGGLFEAMVTTVHTELESLRRLHAQDLLALQAAADLIARQQAENRALQEIAKPASRKC